MESGLVVRAVVALSSVMTVAKPCARGNIR